VKRWGKSPPLQAQAWRHGKPHRVQGQIGDLGAARSTARVGHASRVFAARLCRGAERAADKRATPGWDARLTVLTAARDGAAKASQAGRLSYFGSGSGYWLLRQMILSIRKSEDRIRLTALPESENGVRKVQAERWSAARKKCWGNWQRGEPEFRFQSRVPVPLDSGAARPTTRPNVCTV